MTPNPVVLPGTASVHEASRAMRDAQIGDVIVFENNQVCGIVTDRDIVVSPLASGRRGGRRWALCRSGIWRSSGIRARRWARLVAPHRTKLAIISFTPVRSEGGSLESLATVCSLGELGAARQPIHP
jgi:CBS domain